MRIRTTSLTLAAAAVASVLGLASIAAATQAEARGKRAVATPTMAAKSGATVRDHRAGRTAARKLECIGQYCPKPVDAYNAPNTGTHKPLPPRTVRDHRGPNGGGGGVTVTAGPPRRTPTLCAGWGC